MPVCKHLVHTTCALGAAQYDVRCPICRTQCPTIQTRVDDELQIFRHLEEIASRYNVVVQNVVFFFLRRATRRCFASCTFSSDICTREHNLDFLCTLPALLYSSHRSRSRIYRSHSSWWHQHKPIGRRTSFYFQSTNLADLLHRKSFCRSLLCKRGVFHRHWVRRTFRHARSQSLAWMVRCKVSKYLP